MKTIKHNLYRQNVFTMAGTNNLYSDVEVLAALMAPQGPDLCFLQKHGGFSFRSKKAIETKCREEFKVRCKEFKVRYKLRPKETKKRPEPQRPSKPATKEDDEPTDGLGTDWEALGAGKHPF